MTATAPDGLSAGGRALWRDITEAHELDAAQRVQLTEACRIKDRLDKLDALLSGDVGEWMSLNFDEMGAEATLVVNSAAKLANESANLLKQLLAALRLPDEATGKKPQFRGPRGAQKPSVPSGISSLERARAAKAGA